MSECIIQKSTLSEIGDAIREVTKTTDEIPVSDIASTIRSIKTGVELNFSIVGGTTVPTNPVENTIWVKTSSEIVSWCFSDTEPLSPTAGCVWIQTGDYGRVTLNALKECCIYITPVNSYQYSGNKWVVVSSVIYQNGWKSWVEYLYSNGNEYTDVTGGWASTYRSYGSNYTSGTYSNSDGTLKLTCSNGTVGNNIYAYTSKAINLSNAEKLTVNVSSRSGSDSSNNYGAYMFLTNSNTQISTQLPTSNTNVPITGSGSFSIDLSSISGSYYVVLSCYGSTIAVTDIYYY